MGRNNTSLSTSPHLKSSSTSHRTTRRSSFLSMLLITAAAVLLPTVFALDATNDILPHHCDLVKCPPLSQMTCPPDSDVRDAIHAWDLLDSNNNAHEGHAEDGGSAGDLMSGLLPPNATAAASTTEIVEELYAQCCLSKKCLCRTCYIPDCHNEDEVVVELVAESMRMPGHCCGEYECQREPNCTEVRETENYWRTDCKRCRCYAGERICHQICDEGHKTSTAICNSKTLNRFFEHGETWKAGCQECECVNGEEKCVMSFCRSVSCPPRRQVMIKGNCCPVCWPKGIPMPHADREFDADDGEDDTPMDEENYDENVGGDEDEGLLEYGAHEAHEVDTLPNLVLNETSSTTTTTTTTTTTPSSSPATNPTTTTTTAKPVAALELGPVEVATSAPTPIPTTPSTTTTATPPPNTSDCPFSPPSTSTAAPTPGPSERQAKLQEAAAVATAAAAPQPCPQHYPAPVYPLYPVELVCQCPEPIWLYVVIGLLFVIVIFLVMWVLRLKYKKRSYTPVSPIDDNFNTTSYNSKKAAEFA